MTASSSTSEIIRRLAAEHGIPEAQNDLDRFVAKITELNTDSTIEFELETRLLGKLMEIGVLTTDEGVELILKLHDENEESGQ